MAYKFQLGQATLSGSLTQEGNIVSDGGNIVASGGVITGSSNLLIGGTVQFDGVADAAADVSADSFYFLDGDSLMKRESMADYATSIAGDALAASSGVLAVQANSTSFAIASDEIQLAAGVAGDGLALSSHALSINVDDSTIELDSDSLRLKDDGVTGAKLAPAVAGLGLAQDGSGNLDVQTSGAIKIASDKLGISGSFAGIGLAYRGGVDSISEMELDISEYVTNTPASGDKFLALDQDGSTEQLSTVDSLATLFAGNGLAASSAVMELDLNELSAATVDVANDSIAIVDADDNSSKKESIADLVNAMVASTDGLQASAGVISVNANSTSFEFDAGEMQLKSTVAATNGGLVLDSEALKLSGSAIADGTAAVAGDEFMFIDADGSIKRETMADYATAIAGDALAASSGVLAVQVNSTSFQIDSDEIKFANTVVANNGGLALDSEALKLSGSAIADGAAAVAGDEFMFIDSDGSVKRESMADYATAIAGDGMGAASGVLAVNVDDSSIEIDSDSLRLKDDGVTGAKLAPAVAGLGLAQDGSGNLDVQTSGAIKIASDKLGISGSFAGPGLAYQGGVDSISEMELDISEFSAVTPAASDSFLTLDSDGSTEQRTTTDALATLFAGNGLSAASAVMALDLNELSDTAIDVANDSLAFVDADDNGSKKESIADLVSAMAGAGLTATSGVLSVQSNNVSAKADGDTLAEGYNFFATVSAAATVTLPASPSVGDVVTLKAKDGVSTTNYIQVNRAGSQTIDGETSVRIESPYGAISMVYVANNDWRLV